jgi:polyisoprenoid-binding protein YceI
VKTTRTGLGAKAGHDLTIEVTRWSGEVDVGPAGSSVAVEIDAGSLEVREGTGGVKPLTGSDRSEIKRNLQQKILHTDRHPTITFRSTRVEGTEALFTVEGDLTIVGVALPVTLRGRLGEGRVQGSATVTQTRWGIRPYSALFGALKLNDDVEIEFDVVLMPKP